MTDDARTRRLRELLAKWRGYMDPTAEIYADQLAAVLDTEGDRPEPCCNCLSKLPGYNVKAWRWLNPNVGPFCEDCWKEVKKGERHERTRRLRELLEQIEKALDRQKAACFGIDVREKWQSDNPVIQSVIDAPDAMHDLLFIRQALRAVLDTEGDRPMHDQEYYDKSRRINMGLEPAEGDASPAPPYRPQRSFYEITEAMLTYGGGFVHNLAVALRSADETNKRILVLAFQDYWRTYDEMAGMPRPDPPVQP